MLERMPFPDRQSGLPSDSAGTKGIGPEGYCSRDPDLLCFADVIKSQVGVPRTVDLGPVLFVPALMSELRPAK
jgi:hypothetical protein